MTAKKLIKFCAYPVVKIMDGYFKWQLTHNPKAAFEYLWLRKYRRIFHWNNPQTLNEKISWMIYKSDTSKWTELADKYLMRLHLEKMGLGEYLPKLYGCWERAEDIDFDAMPEKFVLKCNHDCASTKIVDKRVGYDREKLIVFYNERVNKPYGIETLEPHYVKIQRRIIAEEFIENDRKEVSSNIIDYKFWCFHGQPYYCLIVANRDEHDAEHINLTMYDAETWTERRDLMAGSIAEVNPIPRPRNLDTMLMLCRKISVGFPQLRLDLYESGDRVFVGEMTFTSCAGRMYYFTDECQRMMGSLITLPPAIR